MAIRIFLAGRVVEPEEAQVSVFNRGFLYGDSVFETLPAYGCKLVFLAEHLARLARSAARIGLALPDFSEIEAAVRLTLAAANNPRSRVRITVSRGDTQGELDPGGAGPSHLVITVHPLSQAPLAQAQGVSIRLVSPSDVGFVGGDPNLKSGNYLGSVLAIAAARRLEPGVFEAVRTDAAGRVLEGATSNVFRVHEGRLETPAVLVGLLAGITRAKVLALGNAAGLTIVETGALFADDFRRSDEVFLSNSLRGIIPVNRIDGQVVSKAGAGPITQKLRALYEAHVLLEAQ